MDKIEITGCENCPMFEFDWADRYDECRYPTTFPPEVRQIPDGLVDDTPLFSPEWCPLKKQSLTISIKP